MLQAATINTPHKTPGIGEGVDTEMAEENREEVGQFEAKEVKNLASEKKAGESTKKSDMSKKPPNPSLNLTKFFRPMQPEEKEKLLLNELAKVQQELKTRQQ